MASCRLAGRQTMQHLLQWCGCSLKFQKHLDMDKNSGPLGHLRFGYIHPRNEWSNTKHPSIRKPFGSQRTTTQISPYFFWSPWASLQAARRSNIAAAPPRNILDRFDLQRAIGPCLGNVNRWDWAHPILWSRGNLKDPACLQRLSPPSPPEGSKDWSWPQRDWGACKCSNPKGLLQSVDWRETWQETTIFTYCLNPNAGVPVHLPETMQELLAKKCSETKCDLHDIADEFHNKSTERLSASQWFSVHTCSYPRLLDTHLTWVNHAPFTSWHRWHRSLVLSGDMDPGMPLIMPYYSPINHRHTTPCTEFSHPSSINVIVPHFMLYCPFRCNMQQMASWPRYILTSSDFPTRDTRWFLLLCSSEDIGLSGSPDCQLAARPHFD